MKAKLLIIVSIIFSTAAFSQSVKTLEYNVGLGTFTGLLPFDQPFNLKLINITRNPDSISVRLIEVPKKSYTKISKYKKTQGLNWKVITAEDVYKYSPDDSYISMLDTVIAVESPSDTFYNLAVPFYLKPESKYVIDIKSYVLKEVNDAEKRSLEIFIKTNPLYQRTINQLIQPNILDPKASPALWAPNSLALQDIARQIVKAKNRNYVITGIDEEEQLILLSDFLVSFNNINNELSFLESLVSIKSNPVIKQRDSALLKKLTQINWMRINTSATDISYNSFIRQLNESLTADSLMMDSADRREIAGVRDNIKQKIDEAIVAKDKFNNAFAHIIAQSTVQQSVIASTNSESLLEQAKLHVTFDLGYAYVGQIDRGNAYAALNIYFRSIDTSLPLKNYRLGFWEFIGSRTSLLIGTSLQSIQKDSVRKGLLSNEMALVMGIGFRLLPWFKINGGAYMYYLYSRNPLRTKNDYSFKASPFVSVSIDFNLSSFLETFGNGSIANIFKK